MGIDFDRSKAQGSIGSFSGKKGGSFYAGYIETPEGKKIQFHFYVSEMKDDKNKPGKEFCYIYETLYNDVGTTTKTEDWESTEIKMDSDIPF